VRHGGEVRGVPSGECELCLRQGDTDNRTSPDSSPPFDGSVASAFASNVIAAYSSLTRYRETQCDTAALWTVAMP
jgi:hypothetical protein